MKKDTPRQTRKLVESNATAFNISHKALVAHHGKRLEEIQSKCQHRNKIIRPPWCDRILGKQCADCGKTLEVKPE